MTAWRYASAQRAASTTALISALENCVADKAVWHVSHPLNELVSRDAVIEKLWEPLLNAFPDLERRDDIFIAGDFKKTKWVASTGHFVGTFRNPWLNISPSDQLTFIRFSEFLEIEGHKIVSARLIIDIIGVARQAGIDLLPPGLGAEIIAPAPASQDGVQLFSPDPTETNRTLTLLEAMIAGLMRYDRKSLESMGQDAFWHPNFLWFGPSGIGATRGLNGFEAYHQQPFLDFVPDRIGGDHCARFADGAYAASCGWPSIRATTSGASWISTALPSGIPITMRVMDFWRRKNDKLMENWVFIDIPDVFRQCGVDVFEKLTT